MKLSEWVDYYYKLGWNILPADKGKKFPNISSWKRWQIERVDEKTFTQLAGRFQNINLCLGKVSDIWEIDVDVENVPVGLITDKYRESDIWVCESSNGKVKIFFRPMETLPAKLDLKVNDKGGHVELRGDNHLSVLPPSLHPSGSTYTWLTKGDFLVPIDGMELFNSIIEILQEEFNYQEKIVIDTLKHSGTGVRDFFTKSMKKGTNWSGCGGHYFRLAYCAELINEGYDDEQIHTFFKAHDNKSGEPYSRTITQKKIDELRKKGMHRWTNKKLLQCCPDILGELDDED